MRRQHQATARQPAGRNLKSLALAGISVCIATGIATFSLLSALSTAPAQTPPPQISPQEIQVYRNAHTVIDWTPKEIRESVELKKLRPAANQNDLGTMMESVGEKVAAFIDNLPNTACAESIRSDQVEDRKGTLTEVFNDKFRYLLLRSPHGGWNGFQEYRTDAQGHAVNYGGAKVKSILTSRFALLVLCFDPRIQWSCHYRYFGRQMMGRRDTDVVGFAQNPEAKITLASFSDGKRAAQTLLQGLAWIDRDRHEILRLRTDLLAPPPGSHLAKETTVVDYSPVQLSETSAATVLPRKVVVDLWLRVDAQADPMDNACFLVAKGYFLPQQCGTQVRHFRNTHLYSDYKLFRVESRIGATP